MNYHDVRNFRLFAEALIYGTTYAYIHTDIQSQFSFCTSMWGSLGLAPIIACAVATRVAMATRSVVAPQNIICPKNLVIACPTLPLENTRKL